MSVLVVDDDPGMREYLRTCLASLPARVCEAGSGREALDLLRSHPPDEIDLVIADVVMPEGGGLDLIRELEADPALATLPVLLVTGEALQEVERAGRPVLHKPFNGSLLRLYVGTILQERGDRGILPP